MAQLTRTNVAADRADSDLVVIGVGTELRLSRAASVVDAALEGELVAHLQRSGFKGKRGEVLVFPTFGRIPAASLMVVGVGQSDSPDDIRAAAGAASRASSGYRRVAIYLGQDGNGQAAAEGWGLGGYTFTSYKPTPPTVKTEEVLIAGLSQRDLSRSQAIVDATLWARDLVNEPPSNKVPAEFASEVSKRAKAAGLGVQILDEKALEKRGMNGILTVGKGSVSPPRMVTLTYEPERASRSIGLVGKGITFDSGGLSIKPLEGMYNMKGDCAGAAIVAAAMCALPDLAPRVRVTAAIALAENMPGGRAVKPGDVIRHYGGKTSEVLNTDAEGRLVLADALAWMAEQKPAAIVDAATLTGAIVVALGNRVAGLFAQPDEFAAELEEAGARTGEPVWRMPLVNEYFENIESKVAEVKNTAQRRDAGSIHAALFLRHFVGDTPWAHLDIAGVSFTDKADGHQTQGATAFGTRLLIDWIENRARARRSR